MAKSISKVACSDPLVGAKMTTGAIYIPGYLACYVTPQVYMDVTVLL